MSCVVATESSPLRITGSRYPTWNIWYTLFRIHLFYTCLVAAVVKRMLKTQVTLGNISCVLLNLFKRYICNVQSLLLPPNVPIVNIRISSLVQQLRLLLTLTFAPLPYLFGLCHDMYIQLGRVYLRDV